MCNLALASETPKVKAYGAKGDRRALALQIGHVYRSTFGNLATAIQNCSIVSTIWDNISTLPGFVI